MKRSFTLICLLAIYCISCEGKTELNPEGFVEHRMDIEGNWKIQFNFNHSLSMMPWEGSRYHLEVQGSRATA